MENEVKSLNRDITLCMYMLKKEKIRILLNTIMCLMIGIVFAVILSFVQKDEYVAETTIYSSEYGSYENSVEGITAVKDYSDIITSSMVCTRAISIMGYEPMSVKEMKKAISIYESEEKNVVMVVVVANSEKDAIAIANAVSAAFVSEVRNITGLDAAQVLDEADTAKQYSSVKKTLLFVVILFAVLGCVATCAYIFVRTLVSKCILTVDECRLDGTLEIIGILPDYSIMK